MILLDLIGAPNPKFRSFYAETEVLHNRLVEIEHYLREQKLINNRNYMFQPQVAFSAIDDDHRPFLEKSMSNGRAMKINIGRSKYKNTFFSHSQKCQFFTWFPYRSQMCGIQPTMISNTWAYHRLRILSKSCECSSPTILKFMNRPQRFAIEILFWISCEHDKITSTRIHSCRNYISIKYCTIIRFMFIPISSLSFFCCCSDGIHLNIREIKKRKKR